MDLLHIAPLVFIIEYSLHQYLILLGLMSTIIFVLVQVRNYKFLIKNLGDPFAPFFGIYYYFFGDFYLFIVSNLLGILVKIKLHSIRKIGLYIMGRSDKEKIE